MVLNYILVGCPENIAKRKQFITSIDALPCACVEAWRRNRSKPQSVYSYFETEGCRKKCTRQSQSLLWV